MLRVKAGGLVITRNRRRFLFDAAALLLLRECTCDECGETFDATSQLSGGTSCPEAVPAVG